MKSSKTRAHSHTSSSLFPFLFTLSCLFTPFAAEKQKQSPIKTIVVLVMENRSFDHMLGWMKTNPAINGVTEKDCNPVSTKKPNQKLVCATNDAQYVTENPGHMFPDVTDQVFGSNSSTTPSMLGFVGQALSISENLSRVVMKGFKPESVPVYASLVQEFSVFDRWFSSIPGPTQPNRLFVYSATSHGSVTHSTKLGLHGYPQTTIFDSLYENGKNFGIYHHGIPATLLYKKLRILTFLLKFHGYDQFAKDAKNGKLPSLTVIEPRYFDLVGSPANDDHPSHDVSNGQKLVKEVYKTLRASPQWNETLLVITYDEHGGFYDHVKTPHVNIPNPDGISSQSPDSFKFDRLGVRVPTIMVSPWIKKGTVISQPSGPSSTSEFEHSSIPATVKKIFNLSSAFLTSRDAWAGTFEGVVSELTSPRTDCPVTLPDVKPMRSTPAQEDAEISEFQGELVQLASVLNGDHSLSSFSDDMIKKMTVKQAHAYVNAAVSRYLQACKEAVKMGADESAVVNMKPSLTTRVPNHN